MEADLLCFCVCVWAIVVYVLAYVTECNGLVSMCVWVICLCCGLFSVSVKWLVCDCWAICLCMQGYLLCIWDCFFNKKKSHSGLGLPCLIESHPKCSLLEPLITLESNQ